MSFDPKQMPELIAEARQARKAGRAPVVTSSAFLVLADENDRLRAEIARLTAKADA